MALGLLAVAAVKGAVAWGPVLSRRWIGFAGGIARRLSIFAGLVLAIYGVVLTAVGSAVSLVSSRLGGVLNAGF